MRALVVYESMFGNTHTIAAHIAAGLDTVCETTVVPVHEATAELVGDSQLVVVGGPTHVHGMSSARSRSGATEIAADDEALDLEPNAGGDGLRDWFTALAGDAGDGRPAAAFDTRVHASTVLSGQAAKGIAKRLRSHGFDLLVEVESFFVDRSHHLEPLEAERATAWGRAVAIAAQRAATAR